MAWLKMKKKKKKKKRRRRKKKSIVFKLKFAESGGDHDWVI